MTTTISTKVPDELSEAIENEKAPDESTSAAVRRLVRSGLEDNREGVWLASLFAHLAFFGAYYTGGNAAAAAVGLAFMIAVFTWATIPPLKSILSND
jgi:Flp pilus assembly protein TadB